MAPDAGLHSLMQRCVDLRPASGGLFNLREGDPPCSARLSRVLEIELTEFGAVLPSAFCVGSHTLAG